MGQEFGAIIAPEDRDNSKLCLEETVGLIYRHPLRQLLAKVEGPFLMARSSSACLACFRVTPVSRARGRPDQPPLVGLRTIIHVLQVRNLRFKQSEW